MKRSREQAERARGRSRKLAESAVGAVVLLGLGTLGLATSCASPPGPDAEEGPRIVLERAERAGFWRATYELGAETDSLRFQRPASFYREDVWEVVTPGWRLARDGDRQTLSADPGAETDRVVVEFPVHTENLPKEYELFQTFTDGSLALYTGHLYVTRSAPEVEDEKAKFLRRIELRPAANEHLVVEGEIRTGRTTWTDSRKDGTYVYFGRIEPLESDHMVGVVDPGAPAWIVDRLRATLPRIFSLYTEGLDKALPWKPVVLFSFDDTDTSGLSSGGGTLHGLVQMTVSGHGWREETPESSEQLLWLIAHEAAHFWNGQLYRYQDMADSWLHEGSADAFAGLVLERFGVLDRDRLTERRNRALNACAMGLRDGPLSSSNRRGAFGNYYSCGELIAVWSGAAVPGSSELDRLFEVWRAVFAATDPLDGVYDRRTYLQALESLGVEEPAREALRDFVDTEHADPAAALVEFMGRVGLEIETLERPPPELRAERARGALQHLMAQACGGRYSFHSEPGRLRTVALAGCEPFRSELLVTAIEGHAVGSEGDRAFEAAADRCRQGEPVRLGLAGGRSVGVACETPPPPLPTPLVFGHPNPTAMRPALSNSRSLA